MTLGEFLLQLNPFIFSVLIISSVAIIIFFGNRGIELTSKGKTLRFFDRKKDTAIQQALIMEKIIEFAYEISYIKKDKRIKSQMSFTEQTFDEVISIYEKNFRSCLEDTMKERKLDTMNLERHPDLDMFKICMEILKTNWKNFSMNFFADLFEKIESFSSSDFEVEKEQFLFSINKEKENVLNNLYKDDVGNYKRIMNRSSVYYCLRKDTLSNDHSLREIVNHSKTIFEKIKLEEISKRKDLEEFIKENII